MAHWIRLPDGGYVNTDTLSAVGPEMPSSLIAPGQGHYRSYGTPDGYRSRAEDAAADALAAAIEAQQQQALAPTPATGWGGLDRVEAQAQAEAVARWIPDETPPASPSSTEAARLIRMGEERAFVAIVARLRDRGLSTQEIGRLLEGVRQEVGRPDAPPLDDPDPLGSRDEFPGIRQLDLRQGDDLLSLRYDGVDYVAAIKLRFGDAPEGMSDRYLEVSGYNPHEHMWTLIERVASVPKTSTRFAYALGVVMKHDRVAFLGD
jgi:hypothetical protein